VSEPHRPFIPSWLDDLGLGSREFRVLCHLWRRGETHSTAATIATVCRIKRETVFAILNDLEKLGLIHREHRAGRTTLIQPVPPNGTGKQSNPSPETGRPVSPETGRDAYPGTGHHPSPQTGHKGIPSKGIPERVSQKGKLPLLTDEQFIESLKANPAFAGINIDHEIGKARAWITAHPGRKFSRPFVVNWLNRIEKPMTTTHPPTDPDRVGDRIGNTILLDA
jgi:hypothetical protein